MPSRNSVNRPKDGILRRKKAIGLARKRAAKRAVTPSGRTTRGPDSVVGVAKSTAVALYTGVAPSVGVLTTQTLSNKRRKKLERNKIYIDRRSGKTTGAESKEDDTMEVDEETVKIQKQIKSVREAMWSVVEQGVSYAGADGEGTTLGGPAF